MILTRPPFVRGPLRFPGQVPSTPAFHRAVIASTIILGMVALLALTMGRGFFPLFMPLFNSLVILASLAELATALVLVTMWRPWLPERAVTALALGYVVTGLLTIITTLVLPLWPAGPALIAANPQAGAWLYAFGHAGLAAPALVYARLRSSDPGGARTSRRFAALAIGTAVTYLVAAGVAAFVFGESLPHLVEGGTLSGLRTSGVGPFIVALCAFAAWRVLRVRPSAEIDQALGFSLLVFALEATLNVVDGQRFTIAWYVSRALMCIGSCAMLVAAIRTLVRSRSTLIETQAVLARTEGESIQRAERIRALGSVVSNDALSEERWVRSVLEAAAATLRPLKRTCALLGHIDGATLVIDEAAWGGPEPVAADPPLMQRGAHVALAGTLFDTVAAAGTTCAWADLEDLGDAARVWRELGWRSLIAVPVGVGRTPYLLAFGSPDTMLDEPIAEDDVAYVDVLASFVAHRFSERQQRERIQYQIEHDALTGLKNRAQFRAALRRLIAEREPFALAFIDVDGFTSINQTAGHMIADELLVEIAVGLDRVDERDLVARLGGDDFAVVLRGVGADDVEARLSRYVDVFRNPFHTGDRMGTRMLSVTASLGATLYPADGATPEELIRSAEVALVAAKELGGSASLRFDRAMLGRLERAYIKSVELSDAIDGGGLELAYQPTFDLTTRTIIGAEALVRWNHPTRGRLMPAEFIEFAERNALIGRLTRWVMARVIADLSTLRGMPSGFRAYFNLATPQLDDLGFIAELEAQLRAAPGVAAHLGVEITETAAINNTDHSHFAIDRFRRLGLRVAIDDFGTGYSSLSYLKRLPVDMIKIDRAFINGLPDDEKDVALCELLLQIAHRFDLVALAEGIETEPQRDWLREHNCAYGQGYLVSRPVPFGELVRLLEPLGVRGTIPAQPAQLGRSL
jgi:diguanylate cyclase (GGDEF)-like protein